MLFIIRSKLHFSHIQAFSEGIAEKIKLAHASNKDLHRSITEMIYSLEQIRRNVEQASKSKEKQEEKPQNFIGSNLRSKKRNALQIETENFGRSSRSSSKEIHQAKKITPENHEKKSENVRILRSNNVKIMVSSHPTNLNESKRANILMKISDKPEIVTKNAVNRVLRPRKK